MASPVTVISGCLVIVGRGILMVAEGNGAGV
jgi:hypothetical protein